MDSTEIELSYGGQEAEHHQLDFYDAAVALVGFQRSLAITTHAVLHGEVITQSPALKGARILVQPPESGSWKIAAAVVFGTGSALYAVGTAPKDTPLGHLVSSAYDYVISETLGFHVDYDKSLGQQYEDLHRSDVVFPVLSPNRLQSVIEKCEVPIRDMHRPIVKSRTAEAATLMKVGADGAIPLGHAFTRQTYDFMLDARPRSNDLYFEGRVSSYNMNTFKGRVFLGDAERAVPFDLSEQARTPEMIVAITRSLAANAVSRRSPDGKFTFHGLPIETRTGRLKSIIVLGPA
jgi:hypothetical protein